MQRRNLCSTNLYLNAVIHPLIGKRTLMHSIDAENLGSSALRFHRHHVTQHNHRCYLILSGTQEHQRTDHFTTGHVVLGLVVAMAARGQ